MSAVISMATCKSHSAHSHRFQEDLRNRKRNGVVKVRGEKAKLAERNVKKANLWATRRERIKIPNHGNGVYHISQFLSHPSGVEAILNTKALQTYQLLDSNLYRANAKNVGDCIEYRLLNLSLDSVKKGWQSENDFHDQTIIPKLLKCILPQIKLLNFEVGPVIDLQVTPSAEGCVVEMISCKFEGSDVVERQNEHFSASMRNNIRWETIASEQFLDVDVSLNLVLEIYTQPFVMLPPSTVEGPGNMMMQALVDQLLPLLLQQLLQDYEDWVSSQESKNLKLSLS